MFIAALFIIARTWKQPRCPSADEWISELWYIYTMEYSVQFSHSVVSDSLWPHGLQHARPLCPSQIPRAYSDSCPLSQWCHPLSSPSPSAFNLSQHQGLFKWVSSSHQMAKVLEFQLQHQSFQWIFRTCILSRVRQITSPGWMHETGARAWCTGKTQRNRVEREMGRRIRMGNTCNSMADSCQCMTKPTAMLWSN